MKLNWKYFAILTAVLCLDWVGHNSFGHAKSIEGAVNVNTASVQELTLLPGVGPAKAEEIVKFRQGKTLTKLEDLKAVKGLGDKRLEAMKSHVIFTGPSTAKASTTASAKPVSAPAAAATPPAKAPTTP